MQNKPFDAFEERLQKAAEQPVNGGEEAAWVRMEKLLDAPKRRRLALPLWWWLADAFMLLGIGLLLMKGIDNQPTVVNFGQREAATAPAPAAADGLATASANTGNVAKGTGEPASTSSNAVNAGTGTDEFAGVSVEASPASRNTSSAKKAQAGRVPLQLEISIAGGEKVPSHKQPPYKVPGTGESAFEPSTNLAAGANLLSQNHALLADSAYPNAKAGQSLGQEGQTNDSQNLTQSIAPDTVPTIGGPKLPSASRGPQNSALRKPGSFFATAWLNPGAATTPNGSWGPVGWGYGAGIGYQISQRLSIQASAIWTPAVYTAAPQDYYVKPGSYWSQVAMKEIDAECRILQLPVELQYQLWQKKSWQVSVGAGVITSVMNSEVYDYYYNRNGSVYHAQRGFSTQQVEWLSGASFSLGVAKSFGNRFGAFVSPNYVLPLHGAGEGKVKLQGLSLRMGLSFNVLGGKK